MSLAHLLLSDGRCHEIAERNNFLETITELEVLQKCEMTKEEIYCICNIVAEDLQSKGSRSLDLTLLVKVLISLKILASGSYQNCSKDFMHVSQPTVSRVFSSFVNSIVSKALQFIHMPRNEMEIAENTSDFQQIAEMPKVVGAVDGSHIPMIAPAYDEYAYVNRKQFHSINMQAICDANLVFQDVVARLPGSHHDSITWQSSSVYDGFENDELGDCWLLEDSGYPLQKWLITPFGNPTTADERRFNTLHRKTYV